MPDRIQLMGRTVTAGRYAACRLEALPEFEGY